MRNSRRKRLARIPRGSFSLDFVRHDHTEIDGYLHPVRAYKKGRVKPVEYLNLSTSFDIESTSFFRHKETMQIIDVKKAEKVEEKELKRNWEKIAIMYAWVFTYDGHAFVGRTWEEFMRLLEKVIKFHELSTSRIMVCGVHNLGYEFQYFCRRLEWDSVFAIKERTPAYARTKTGIEFRCTLTLSGYSLAKVGEHLLKYRVEKKIGDLDYIKLRHSKTPLTEEEWGYVVNDGLIVGAYLQELIEKHKLITRIPLTKTGFVRKYLRKKCYFNDTNDHSYKRKNDYLRYRRIMLASPIQSAEEYLLLKQLFTGAIVHCNTYASGIIFKDVESEDECSAYPTQIAIGYFPFGRGEWVMPKSYDEFKKYVSKKACVIDASFHDIEKSQFFESLISKNKCIEQEGFEEDNGRLIKAKRIRIVINEIDFSVYKKFYKWKRMTIHRMIVYEKRRLPTNFVSAVLDLYADKTTLKDVEGKESEYMHAKENCNSTYGCMVTDICKDKTEYVDGQWITTPCDIENELKRYNETPNRFTCYQWGCWITSLARRALASAIYAIGMSSDTKAGDYLYSDTDSVKFINPEKHRKYFEEYNAYMLKELKKASEYHHIPIEKFMPKDINGKAHPLGVWENETSKYEGGVYKRFKSLGAKRYALEYVKDGKVKHSLTIAGVNKKKAIPYIEKHEKDFFDFMHFNYLFVEDCCGKNLHTYIDDEKEGILTDYLGNVAEFRELSSVHLMSTTYKMTASDDYLALLSVIESSYMIV